MLLVCCSSCSVVWLFIWHSTKTTNVFHYQRMPSCWPDKTSKFIYSVWFAWKKKKCTYICFFCYRRTGCRSIYDIFIIILITFPGHLDCWTKNNDMAMTRPMTTNNFIIRMYKSYILIDVRFDWMPTKD